MTPIDMIQEERRRQIAKGYDAAHDDEHEDGELAAAAASFAAAESKHARSMARLLWPFDDYPDMANPKIYNLAKAGALIVAEMERLIRDEKARATIDGHDIVARAPGCECHLEAGDSPCRVHGEDDHPRTTGEPQ